MAEDLRIGVLGSGGRGWLARHAHHPGEGSRIVACCDILDSVLAENRTAYGEDVALTNDYQQLLAQPLDAVFICTPDYLHEQHALAALEAVRAIYLEKPMAITIDGCDRILAKIHAQDARLFVGHNMRYMEIFRKMRKLITDGVVGRVKSIWCRHFISYGGDAYFRDWHSQRANTTGLLLQKGAHDLDVIHWLAGAYATRVSAFGNLAVYGECARREDNSVGHSDVRAAHWPPHASEDLSRQIDIEDQSIVNMELAGGILATYQQCHFTPDACRNYVVIGDEGRMENYGDGPNDPIIVWNTRRHDWGSFDLIGDAVHHGESVDDSGHGGADSTIVEEFLHYVQHGGVTTATPEAARMAVAVGYQATMSLRNGGTPMAIPALPAFGTQGSA